MPIPTPTDEVFGHRYNNATPFRRAIEEELIDPKRYIIVGLRALYHANDLDWVEAQGATIVTIDDFCEMGIPRVTEKIRAVLGDRAAYLTFDIDGLDPAHAPGTGALEPGGLTTREALGILRGLFGLNFVGADLTEVAPPPRSVRPHCDHRREHDVRRALSARGRCRAPQVRFRVSWMPNRRSR